MQEEAKGSGRSWIFNMTLLLAIIGAVPTGIELYKAWKYGLDFGDVARAEEQRRLWEKNFDCTAQLSYQEVQTQEKVLVKVGTCPSGDVLINAILPDENKQVFQWVSIDRLKTTAALDRLLGRAYAQTVSRAMVLAQAPTAQVQCQEWLDAARTRLTRIVNEGGKCFREDIEVLSGKVGVRAEVACDAKCAKP
jgi:hypothetical protein